MVSIPGKILPDSLLLYAFFVLFVLLAFLASRRVKPDSREPPYIQSGIPLIGHVFGILRYGVPYYERVSQAPIFTLNLLVNRLYVVASAKMVSAVQKNHKIISFDPFMTAAANRMAGINGSGLRLIQDTRSGGGDLNNKVLQAMTPSLLGKELDNMNRTMLAGMMPLIDQLVADPSGPVDIHMWCRHIITVASTDAIWGSKNPFRSQGIVDDFWYFESHLSILLAKVFPSITARKAYVARESLVQAMHRFSLSGGYDEQTCSHLAVSRWQTQKDHGATDENIARLETALNIGVLSNTVPSTFWTIFDIYSQPALLEAVRNEIQQNAVVVDPITNVHSIDLGRLRSVCPTFVSSFQETLRVHSNGAPTRMVYEDVMLDNTYLLKAGSVLQISGPAINNETSVWGNDAKKFDISHFLDERQVEENCSPKSKPRPTSFMSFGASPNLCPGRHFATAEIVSLVAMLVMRTDIVPVKEKWWIPRLNPWAVAATTTPPAEEYPVTIKEREEYKSVNWSFLVEGKKDRFDLITG